MKIQLVVDISNDYWLAIEYLRRAEEPKPLSTHGVIRHIRGVIEADAENLVHATDLLGITPGEPITPTED